MTGETAEAQALPGGRLRNQRERRGLTLVQVSSELHIDQHLLAALEEDNYDALGAPIFVKGHLRNYARLLGLDPAELVALYEASQQPSDPALVTHRAEGARMDEGSSSAWVGWFGWLFLIVLGVLLAGWWYYQQEGGADLVFSNTVDSVPLPDESIDDSSVSPQTLPQATSDELAAGSLEETVDPSQTGVSAANDAVTGPATTVPGVPDESQTQAADVQAQAEEAAPVETRPATPAPRQGGAGLTLEFTEESWVEIYDAEGRPILYDLLGPGVRREISATGRLRLFIGNTDGVEVYVAGERFDLDRYRRSDSTARFTVNVPAR